MGFFCSTPHVTKSPTCSKPNRFKADKPGRWPSVWGEICFYSSSVLWGSSLPSHTSPAKKQEAASRVTKLAPAQRRLSCTIPSRRLSTRQACAGAAKNLRCSLGHWKDCWKWWQVCKQENPTATEQPQKVEGRRSGCKSKIRKRIRVKPEACPVNQSAISSSAYTLCVVEPIPASFGAQGRVHPGPITKPLQGKGLHSQ